MAIHWYYSHAGGMYGPFTESEMQDLVACKELLASDLVWPYGRPQKDAAPASVVFEFPSAPPSASVPVPNWLDDVAAAETKGPVPPPKLRSETPEWLEDVRLWVGLELCAPPRPEPIQATGVPDWVGDWLAPPAPKPPAPASVATDTQEPVYPVAPASPSKPARKQPSPKTSPPPPPTSDLLAKQLGEVVAKNRIENGFDLETGQILDPEKFAKWKQQQAQPMTAGQPAAATIIEIFREARTAIERWVDDDANRKAIMDQPFDEIVNQPKIQGILQQYVDYGDVLRERLIRHLEFLLVNRRKYYNAVTG